MRSLAPALSLLAVLALVAVPPLAAADCEHSKPLTVRLDAAGAASLSIEARAGFLVIEGSPGADQVVVEGRACASKKSLLDEIDLETREAGDRLSVRAKMPDQDFNWGNYARLDMTVTVPSDLHLDVEDGSGETDIAGVASLELVDGSGEIDIRDVSGDVDVQDGSGELDIRDVLGSVTLKDGSGSVTVIRSGSVYFKSDGSGEIELAQIDGDVTIRSDGSGGINIRDVSGSVRVGSDGSGSIWVTQVIGDFELGSDGSGSVHVDDVDGTVSLP